MAKVTGGGIQSSVNREVGVRGGKRTTNAVSPAGLSQYGTAQGGRIKGSGSFTGISSAKNVFEGAKTAATPMGNAVAASTVCKPGGSRTVYRAGYQSATPNVQMPKGGRDILKEFGPEASDPSPLVSRRRG
jgi:hypothetical protein